MKKTYLLGLFLPFLLVACGGGSSDSSGTPVPVKSSLLINPNPVVYSYEYGNSSRIQLNASPTNPSDFAGVTAVYAFVIDDKGVLTNKVDISGSGTNYLVSIYTSPTQSVGRYQGQLQIKLCRDSQCVSQFPGSPVQLPYDIEVKPSTRVYGMNFDPVVATANVENGLSSSMSIAATPLNTLDYVSSVRYAEVIDAKNIILTNATVTTSAYRYQLNLATNPNLAIGSYQGSVQVKLCVDQTCSTQISGSPFTLPYNIVVKPVALKAISNSSTTFSVPWGSSLTDSTQISVSAPGLSWQVKSSATWLTTSLTGGTGNTSFTVQYKTNNLAEGSYNTNIDVISSDGQTVSIPIKLTVNPVSFKVDSNGTAFSAINGAPISSQNISLALQGSSGSKSWTATSDRSWLTASPQTGDTPATINLSVNPVLEKLASGKYLANLSFTSPNVQSRSIQVSLDLIAPTLSIMPVQWVLGGDKGRDFSSQNITLNLNTGTNRWPWMINAVPNEMTVSTASGQVNASTTSFTLSPNLKNIPAGSTSKLMSLSAKVNGDTPNANVNLLINRDERKILPSRQGLAFTSTPSKSILTQSITLKDNFNLGASWTASSDQAWLTVPSSGTISKDGSSFTLVANTNGLASDTVSYATVTIVPSDTTIAPVKIKAAIWVGTSTPSAMTKIALNYTKLIADTIRPYVYVNTGASSIDVYNVYTGKRVTSVTNLGGALGDMAVSSNGDNLYVLNSAAKEVVVVDLTTMTKKTAWSLKNAVSQSTHLMYFNPNGKALIAVSDSSMYTTEGQAISANGFFGSMSTTSDGRAVYTHNEGTSPSSIAGYDTDYSAINGGIFMSKTLGGNWSVNNSSNGQDIAVSPDGSHVYMASGAPYRCSRVDPKDLSFIGSLPGGDAYPNNVEVGNDGRVYCGISGWYSTYDVWMHTPDGVMLKGFKFAGYAKALKSRQLVISPDGLMMIGLTDDPLLVFVSVGP